MKALLIAAATATLSLAAVADANAWTRYSTTTGSYGRTVHSSASGGCGGYSCNSSATYTNRYGQTATRSSSTVCDPATQSCTRNSTVTGPYGGQAYRSSTISR